ncbi:hypothetical protein [Sinorhizobium sp. BJ1]|uniref:hypothetical protein n=1 Tax=Sinorhizobium sp. BJ1 TaxID=2035455 RepID=UPI000BEC89E7|nr:hypothetical protein [Sinorhizobium sp. BJ1]PDT79972.1 hypothetical protein CO676_30465 [Sinorhizobium sp. BJ1]
MATIKELKPMDSPAFKEGDKVIVTVGHERRLGTIMSVDKMGYGVVFQNGRREICWPDEVSAA